MTPYPKLFDLTGKIALITGSSQGLGLILAQGLSQAGATIILNGRDTTKLQKAVDKLNDDGLKVFGYSFDVRDEIVIQEQIKKIQQEVGIIDILINNAGIQIRSPLENFNTEDWQKIIDINLTGAFLVAKAVAQGMIKRHSGKIINICSVQSELARPAIAPYTATKGGLKMLTKAMATDWGKYNIQVNGLAPGYFKTEMTRALYEDEKFNTWLCSRTPANRWGNPEELIGAAIFLASPASSYVNGQILFVDGGLVACV
ncbi:SDR family oxidoreductase [candidate division KSB1 bacterium]|nr:SDR family oxidoreductase [candidate division KSB1 bacterium]